MGQLLRHFGLALLFYSVLQVCCGISPVFVEAFI